MSECRKLPIGRLVHGEVYHNQHCHPFLYLHHQKKAIQIGGAHWAAGWQFLNLKEKPGMALGKPIYHQEEKGFGALKNGLHRP